MSLYQRMTGRPAPSDGPMHPSAILTGGSVPAHVPGAYPRLSCCGGPVALVAIDSPEPEWVRRARTSSLPASDRTGSLR